MIFNFIFQIFLFFKKEIIIFINNIFYEIFKFYFFNFFFEIFDNLLFIFA